MYLPTCNFITQNFRLLTTFLYESSCYKWQHRICSPLRVRHLTTTTGQPLLRCRLPVVTLWIHGPPWGFPSPDPADSVSHGKSPYRHVPLTLFLRGRSKTLQWGPIYGKFINHYQSSQPYLERPTPFKWSSNQYQIRELIMVFNMWSIQWLIGVFHIMLVEIKCRVHRHMVDGGPPNLTSLGPF